MAVAQPGEDGQGERLAILAERDVGHPREDHDLRTEISDRIVGLLLISAGHVKLIAEEAAVRTALVVNEKWYDQCHLVYRFLIRLGLLYNSVGQTANPVGGFESE